MEQITMQLPNEVQEVIADTIKKALDYYIKDKEKQKSLD